MFCPKCRYTSFDHLPACPKCAYEWTDQKKTFNMEWMVPTAAEGMNIFTPASPEGQAQAEETGPSPEMPSPPKAAASQDTDSPVQPAPSSTEKEIDLNETDLESLGDEAALSEKDMESAAGKRAGQEASLEVDDEISFDGLQDFFTDLTEEGEEEGEAAPDSGDTDISLQEPDLEIEIEDQSAEEEQGPAESQAEEQDDLDLDISSILEDIDSEAEDGSSGEKKWS